MLSITEYINEQKLNGHEYYWDGNELVQDDITIGFIEDDNVFSFVKSFDANDKEKANILKFITKPTKAREYNDIHWGDYVFWNGMEGSLRK